MKRVLVVVGTPGVGKSSVSSMLASRLSGIHVNLSGLVNKESLSCGLDEKRGTLKKRFVKLMFQIKRLKR